MENKKTKLDRIIEKIEILKKNLSKKDEEINPKELQDLLNLQKDKRILEDLKILNKNIPLTMNIGECKKHYILVIEVFLQKDFLYKKKNFEIKDIFSYKEFIVNEIIEFTKLIES